MSDLWSTLTPDTSPIPRKTPSQLQAQRMQENTPLLKRIPSVEDVGGQVVPTTEWESSRLEQRAREYHEALEDLDAKGITDAKLLDEEKAKIQVSMYLADKLDMEPKEVLAAWDSTGGNRYAEEYFKAREMPTSYRGLVLDEITRAYKTWQSLNLSTELMATTFDADKWKKVQDLLNSMPAQREGIDSGWLGNFIKDIPIQVIRQLPYLVDIGAGELLGGAIGAGIGSLVAPGAGTAAGWTWGRRAGGFLEATRTEAASIFLDTMTSVDPETKLPLWQVIKDPEQVARVARWSSMVAGSVIGALNVVGYEALLGTGGQLARDLGLNIIEKAGTRGIFRGTFLQFFKNYGKNVTTEMVTESLESIIEQIGKDVVLQSVNELGEQEFPIAKFADYARLTGQTMDAVLKANILLALPGSMRETRANIEALLAQGKIADAKKRMDALLKTKDETVAIGDRLKDAEARTEELKKRQAALAPELEKIDQAKELDTGLQEKIAEYTMNAWELEELDQFRADSETKQPGWLPAMTRKDYETQEAARRAAEAAVKAPVEQAQKAQPPAAPAPQPQAEQAAYEEVRAVTERGNTPETRQFQPWNDLDTIYNKVEEGRAEFHSFVESLAQKYDAQAIFRPALKDRGRVEAKANEGNTPSPVYNGVLDVEGGTIVSDSYETIAKIVQELNQNEAVVRIKNEFAKPHHTGYRAFLMNVRLGNGAIVELQVTTKAIHRATELLGHAIYEVGREIKDLIRSGKIKATTEVFQIYKNTLVAQRALYDAAFSDPQYSASVSPQDFAILIASSFEISQALFRISRPMGQGLEEILSEKTRKALSTLRSTKYGLSSYSTKNLSVAGLKPSASVNLKGATHFSTITPPAETVAPVPEIVKSVEAAEPFSPAVDLSAHSPILLEIMDGLPNLTVHQAQGVAVYWNLLATHTGETLTDYVRARFTAAPFSAERQHALEALGKKAAVDWNKVGKATIYTTQRSDFSTAVHEIWHVFEYDLELEEVRAFEKLLGIQPGKWSREDKEKLPSLAMQYLLKGKSPTEELRPVFERFSRWVNAIYETARVEWGLNDEIATLYDRILGEQGNGPHPRNADTVEMLFQTDETGRQPRIDDPAELKREGLYLQSEFDRACRAPYVTEAGERAVDETGQPISSRTTPNIMRNLVPGMWMIDDGWRGAHGHEIAQLRQVDPAKIREATETAGPGEIQMIERMVPENQEGRGEDSQRYATWMRQGMTPPPMNLIEHQDGSWRAHDGHRRLYASKNTGIPILAWFWPSADHPDPGAVDPYTKVPIKVGLTYEMATGRSWENDTVVSREMLYQDDPKPDPWTLKSRDLITQKMRNAMPADQVLKLLQANGIKAEEMEWTGLTEFLKGTKKLTPREVLDYIDQHRIRIEERVFENREVTEEEIEEKAAELRDQMVQEELEKIEEEGEVAPPAVYVEKIERQDGPTKYAVIVGDDIWESFDTEEEANSAADRRNDEVLDENAEQIRNIADAHVRVYEHRHAGYFQREARERLAYERPRTRYSQYILPGGKNYREILLTLPGLRERGAVPFLPEGWTVGVVANAQNYDVYRVYNQEGEAEVDGATESEAIRKAQEIASRAGIPLMSKGGQAYHSPHWNEPNVLLHVRFDERTDLDGKKVLFIQEVQSDWHQAGREKGYSKRTLNLTATAYPNGLWRVTDENGELVWDDIDAENEQEAIRIAIQNERSEGGHEQREAVPNAPFKETQSWTRLGLTRMVRWAVENGFERIEWTTGEQQAARYSLEKVVKSIQYDPEAKTLVAWKDEPDMEGRHASRPALEKDNIGPEDLADYIGKEAALKLLAQPLEHAYRIDLPEGWVMRRHGDFWGFRDETGQERAMVAANVRGDPILTAANEHPEFPWKKTQRTEKPYQELKGEDLKVGGQGMRAYYDGILRQVAGKLGKKFGAEVGRATIETGKGTDGAYVQALREVVENPEHYPDPDGDPDGVASLANMVMGFMEENEAHYGEAIDGAVDAGVTDASTLNRLKKEVQERLPKDTTAEVHSLEVTDAMRQSVVAHRDMLFQPSPHEEAVKAAVAKRQPVPDEVLEEYRGNDWADAEIANRQDLQQKARTCQTFPEFFDWQARSHPEMYPNETYYRAIWDKATAATEDSNVVALQFLGAMDDEAIRFAIGDFFLVNEEHNPEAMKKLTPEMREYGKKVVQSEQIDPSLLAKVRDQIQSEPLIWRKFFFDYLTDDVKKDLETHLAAADTSDQAKFVRTKVANERFTDWLQRPGNTAKFLETVGSKTLYQASKLLARMAEKVENNPSLAVETIQPLRCLEEVRKNISIYREMWAWAVQDEEMLRQLEFEERTQTETEEARLLTENQRLRAELRKQGEAARAASLRETWTLADLRKRDKELADLEARYKKDVEEAKQAIREAIKRAKEQARERLEKERGKATLNDVVKSQLWKRDYQQLRQRMNTEVAILKGRLKQERIAKKEAIINERRKHEMERLAEIINRPVTAGISDLEARMIEDIQARIAYTPEDVDASVWNRLREWRRQNPNAPMPSQLVQQIEARDPRKLSYGEMKDLAAQVKSLRKAGRARRMQQLQAERAMMDQTIGEIGKTIRRGGQPKQALALGTRASKKRVTTPALQRTMWLTWRMNRIANMLDGGKEGGPVTNWLWDQVNDATDEVIRQMETYTRENQAKLKELGLTATKLGQQQKLADLPEPLTRGELMGIYIYNQFEDGRFSLKEDNGFTDQMIDQALAALGPEEKQYADWMIERLSSDPDFDRLQQIQLAVSNQRMDRVPRYFPYQRRGSGGQPLMSELAKELLELAGKTTRASPRHGFLRQRMQRVEGVPFPALRLDAPSIYMDHIQKREFYIANALLIKRMNRIFDSKAVKAAMNDRYGDAMVPLVQEYIANYTNPNIYRTFDDYGELARILRGNVGLSLIGSNVFTILKQLPDIPQIMIQAGPVDGLLAAARFVANPRKTIQRMWENAPQLKNRSYDRFIEELKTFDRNTYERIVKTVGEAGFAALKAMDTATNAIGWTAIYEKTMRKTGNAKLAAKRARDFILAKRPAARAKDLSALYRNPGALSWFLLFSNQQNQQWNILTYDIPRKFLSGLRGNGGDMIDAVLNVTGLAVGAICMGLIARKGAFEPEDIGRDFLAMLFGNAPFLGDSIVAAIRGEREKEPVNPIAGAYEFTKLIVDVSSREDTEKVMRDLYNALFTLSGTLGFPVIQAKRIYKTIDTGDPWELIGGPPRERKE